MDHIGLGAGLAALAFWGFIAAVSVAGIWDGVRKREAQHETLRRLAESGQPIDKEVMDKLLMLNSGRYKRYDVDFKVTALWILPVSVGLAVMALVLGTHVPDAKNADSWSLCTAGMPWPGLSVGLFNRQTLEHGRRRFGS